MQHERFIKAIEDSIKNNWDFDALTDYNGATLQYKDLARKIEKMHIERVYRLRDASQRYGIADKFCTTVDEAIAQADVEIDFPTVDRLLADHRAKSTSFLNDALR